MSKFLIGLDIGSYTLKAVQLSQDKKNINLQAAGFIATPLKNISISNTDDEQNLANAINRLIHDMKVSTTNVSASLPSSQVITRVVEVPIMNESELTSSIQWEAEQFIPLPLSKVKIDYAVIDKNVQNQKMKVLLVAAPISLIEKYMRVITLAGLTPISLETEILAMSRSVVHSFPSISDIIIVSIGANTTDIALLHDQNIIFTKSYPIGGNNMTRAISEELGFEINQAEEYKKTYGLEEDKLEGKIATIITPYIKNIMDEIEKTITFFKTQFPKNEITSAVLSGSAAKLPGLVLTITKNLGIDSQLSNPFVNLVVDPNILPRLEVDAPLYTTAVGLALKDN